MAELAALAFMQHEQRVPLDFGTLWQFSLTTLMGTLRPIAIGLLSSVGTEFFEEVEGTLYVHQVRKAAFPAPRLESYFFGTPALGTRQTFGRCEFNVCELVWATEEIVLPFHRYADSRKGLQEYAAWQYSHPTSMAAYAHARQIVRAELGYAP